MIQACNAAEGFYKLMNQMGVTMIPDSADFRLMSNRAVHAFEVLGTQFVLSDREGTLLYQAGLH